MTLDNRCPGPTFSAKPLPLPQKRLDPALPRQEEPLLTASYQFGKYLYHITHQDNIPGILGSGALLCHRLAHEQGLLKRDISDPEVQQLRASKRDPIYRRPLHDYVPLYFRARNPMLYVRRLLQAKLVVLYLDFHRCLSRAHMVFTDGNAAATNTSFFSCRSDLDKVDRKCLEAPFDPAKPDITRKWCAEVLVPDRIHLASVRRAVVSDQPLYDKLQQLQWPTDVLVRPKWFFLAMPTVDRPVPERSPSGDSVTIVDDNLFTSKRHTLVNTVNCAGVMGAGIALEFKLRHPDMFRRYEAFCRRGAIEVGKLWIFKPDRPRDGSPAPWVLCFPTKKHWRLPSRMEYLERGLEKFVNTYRERGIESAAFPVLGSQHGGLDEAKVLALMTDRLRQCTIPIDIYRYDRTAKDELIDDLRARFEERSDDGELAEETELGVKKVGLVRRALAGEERVFSVGQLARTRGIGERTVERVFAWMRVQQPRDQRGSEGQVGQRDERIGDDGPAPREPDGSGQLELIN